MIRFMADADLNEGIVAGRLRREPEMDSLSANDADLEGVPQFLKPGRAEAGSDP